jgi:hypothetical protein
LTGTAGVVIDSTSPAALFVECSVHIAGKMD